MKTCFLRSLPAAALALVTTCLLAAAEPPAQAKAKDDIQEFVFLGEARPVLVRLHVRVDGKPLSAVWDDFMKYLFAYLDRNGDGVLNKDEAEAVPAAEQLTAGIRGFFRGNEAAASLADLDLDKDGKVNLAELSAFYRKKGFTPLQFQLNLTPVDMGAAMAYFGGPGAEPKSAAVSKAIFERLDANKDGKLTKEELTAAPTILLALDENEDEIVTLRELAPESEPTNNRMFGRMMMSGARGSDAAGKKMLLPLATPGETPADLVERMQSRYGANGKEKDPSKDKKLSRKDLGLDEATFARLDANKDGVLDAAELAGFVKRAPDLCVAVRFGKRAAQPTLELASVAGKPALLADKVQQHDEVALLNLGKTRVELRRNDEKSGGNYLSMFIRQQMTAEFKRSDKDKNGYLDAKEAKNNRFLGGRFQTIDRDGDGKITEKEFLAYFDKIQEIQKRAAAGCATLVLRDQSRGLFDLLDVNRDGKLSVREMRQAVNLLASLDHQGKGYIISDDIPHCYQMTLRRGPKEADGFNQEAFFVNRLFNRSAEEPQSTRGPAWFRKMDRNRDGDVSRKEFLFSDEQFRKLDTDGDGLISLEEAEKAGR